MKVQVQKSHYWELVVVIMVSIIFSSSLNGQYNYLGSYDGNGKPNYLEPESDVVSDDFLSNVDASLPESKPVPTYNPQYISDQAGTDVQLTDSAAVWVTFVAEGAGYRNVLGFYSYDLSNPPQNVNDIENETIIFPNVSARYSGGDLLPGDKVKLGDFSAGTGIGWFLIANGWNGSSVGNGNWKVYSNPDFNPEANPKEQTHNVLLNDANNERVVLGFEDIRRDYSSCDQDFNDAIFYVSANPYSAINTAKFNFITNAKTGVTTGGNGGLESNGNLSSKIAVRNFIRQKTKAVDYDAFEDLPKFNKESIKAGQVKSASRGKNNSQRLHELIPTNSLFNTEAYETTPRDLLGITNAQEVFAADYVANDIRMGAAMIMYTENEVYEHTKAVCDRLNGGELLEIIPIEIDLQTFILFKLKQDNGAIEYAINFVVQKNEDGTYLIENNWSLKDYKSASENYNFQFWSSTTSMTVQLVQDALAKIEDRGIIEYGNQKVEIPQVFVKKGTYQLGKLHLSIANQSGAQQIEISGNYALTETSDRQTINRTVMLNGEPIQQIEIPVGKLFDIGIELKSNSVSDVLYTADGAWGTDYERDGAELTTYAVNEDDHISNKDILPLERGVTADGTVTNYISFFKNIQPGGKASDISDYNALQFTASGAQAIQVTVMKASINNWADQFRTTVALSPNAEEHIIYLDDLRNVLESTFSREDIQSVAISIIGDGQESKSYSLEFNNAAFINSEKPITIEADQLEVYPNPSPQKIKATFLSEFNTQAQVELVDMKGSILITSKKEIVKGVNQIDLDLTTLNDGIYILVIRADSDTYQAKVIKK